MSGLGKGRVAEQAAADYLIARGLRLVERNWRCKGGSSGKSYGEMR